MKSQKYNPCDILAYQLEKQTGKKFRHDCNYIWELGNGKEVCLGPLLKQKNEINQTRNLKYIDNNFLV